MDRLVLWHRAVLPSTDEASAVAEVASWTRTVSVRLREAGGTWLGTVGGTTIAAFDLPDMTAALEEVLAFFSEIDRAEGTLRDLRLAFGVAVGEVETLAGPDERRPTYFGEALDRAQALAFSARKGQVLLDETARELASAIFLFGPAVGAPGGVLRGHPIDRRMPRLASCRAALPKLGEPTPVERIGAALTPLRTLALADGVQRVVLRGGSGSGAPEALAAAIRDLGPLEVLRLGAVPGGLEPMGSLRLALLRRFGRAEALADRLPASCADAANVLTAAARGEPTPRVALADALRAFLGRPREGRAKPWVLVDPVAGVDPDTLKLLDALADGSVDLLVVTRAAVDARLPRALAAAPTEAEIRVPLLRPDDARRVAAQVLGAGADPAIVEVVAIHGGDSPLGVVEAARTLVASGDLLYGRAGFEWRLAPREAESRIPLRHLLEDRLRVLEPIPMRMLEIACVATSGFPAEVVHGAAELDGLDAESRAHSVARLRREALLAADDELRPSSEALRAVVLRGMPPGRLAELHRFLADATEAHATTTGALVRASVGFLRCEGGDTEAGARQLLAGATVAAHAGHDRSAVRIAASAVQYNPTLETRVAATRVTHALGKTPPPVPRPSRPPAARPVRMATVVDAPAIPDPTAGVGEEAIQALLAKDYERVDRCIEMAIAEGRSLAAADRLRSMALLVRGDRPGAREAYQRAREQSGEDPQQLARMAVLESWLCLGDGEPSEALRPALSALSIARRLRDPMGETAAMRTLALCYEALGRESDAKAIVDAAPA